MKENAYFSPNVKLTSQKSLSDIHRWKLGVHAFRDRRQENETQLYTDDNIQIIMSTAV